MDQDRSRGIRALGNICHHRFAAHKRDLTKLDPINYLSDEYGLYQSISIMITHEDLNRHAS